MGMRPTRETKRGFRLGEVEGAGNSREERSKEEKNRMGGGDQRIDFDILTSIENHI